MGFRFTGVAAAAAALLSLITAAPSQAAPTHTMEIDATSLSTTTFRVDRAFAPSGSVGTFSGATVQSMDLEEGAYTIVVSPAVPMACTPTVTATGTWNYPTACNDFVGGRDTATLTLAGYPITLDARPLSNTIRLGGFGPPEFFDGPRTFRLAPNRSGSYTVHPGSGVTSLCSFNVDLAGDVDYPDAFEGCLSGRGSDTVTFHGVPVEVDATALTAQRFAIPGANSLFTALQPADAVQAYRMLPLQACCYGFRAAGSPVTSLGWNVDLSSRISYPESVEEWVDGNLTNTLTVLGHPITVDSTRLGPGEFVLESRHFFPDAFERATVQQTRLVPGDYAFASAGFPAFAWSVTADGKVDLAADVECVTGEGTTTLTVGCNRPPDCSSVAPSTAVLWPPNHTLRSVRLSAAGDPDGDAVSMRIIAVSQDEPLDAAGDGTTEPDAARGARSDEVLLRAERSGTGDGRVYRVAFTAEDAEGASCSGSVIVAVPHDRSRPTIDSGESYDSFGPS